MTGFGRASVEAGERRLRVEIRSVNHRGLDLKIRGAESDAYCAAEIGRAVRAAVERGAVTVHVRDESAGGAAGIDEARVRAAHAVARAAAARAGDRGAGRPGAPSPRSWTPGTGAALEGEVLWEALRPAVEAALAELLATRGRRGGRWRPTSARTGRGWSSWRRSCARRRRRWPTVSPGGWSERLDAFRGQPGFEPGRMAQEAALMADRLDVSEELVRLETHLAPRGRAGRGAGGASAESSISSSRRSAAS